MADSGRPRKIVILGGGVSAMTAAYELTDRPGWERDYSITLYQLGWRLGGKGASGRGPHARIEEHGLHMWYGFYENAFRLIQKCYRDLGRPVGAPLSTWEEAFKPQNFTVFQEQVDGQWLHWPIELPANFSTPGTGGELPTLSDYIFMGLSAMAGAFADWWYGQQLSGGARAGDVRAGDVRAGDVRAGDVRAGDVRGRSGCLPGLGSAVSLLDAVVLTFASLALSGARELGRRPRATRGPLHGLLGRFRAWLRHVVADLLARDTNARRLWIVLDLAVANLIGILADDVIEKGFDAINRYDYLEWIHMHGADAQYTVPFVRHNMYDQAFAYENGDINRPNFEAGTVLRAMLRVYFTYKGAYQWKMQAGMGDTIFAPMYEVLKRRGVEFKYFYRVKQLHLSDDRQAIARISLARQVTLKPEVEARGGYAPLVEVKGLPCWPSDPRYEQIVEGDALKRRQIDLESFWTPWADADPHVVLNAGADFDTVILGISLGALPYVCPELIAARPEWQAMVAHVKTTQTQAFQLWLKPDDAGLGWPFWRLQAATLTGYDAQSAPPKAGLDTWADMSDLIGRENWPADHYPENLAYVVGAMLGPEVAPPPEEHGFPEEQQRRAKENTLDFLEHYIGHWWPRATQPDNPAALNWELLVDPQGRRGRARFDAQYWIAGVNPSERYVLSVAGSTQYRLKTNGSGFRNLYVTGDWIYNGLNLGAVESAVMSGMLTSCAISGYPALTEIIGVAPDALAHPPPAR